MPPRRIAILAFDRVNLLDIAGPGQVFTAANGVLSPSAPGYEVIVTTENGGLVSTTSGIKVDSVSFRSAASKPMHTLIVAGGDVVQKQIPKQLLNWVKKQSGSVARTGSVCTGAFITAASGILDQRRAVTHWRYFDEFKRRFPRVRAESDQIYIRDGNIWSSAGVTAGIDLALAMVQEDVGRQIALQTAREIVVFMKRQGGQNQFSAVLNVQSNDIEGKFDELHVWIAQNLRKTLSVTELADRVGMSPRNFSRTYSKMVGKSPARSIELMRMETARRLLETTKTRLEQVSRQCGFGSEERMRKTFLRHFAITPNAYRKRFNNM